MFCLIKAEIDSVLTETSFEISKQLCEQTKYAFGLLCNNFSLLNHFHVGQVIYSKGMNYAFIMIFL